MRRSKAEGKSHQESTRLPRERWCNRKKRLSVTERERGGNSQEIMTSASAQTERKETHRGKGKEKEVHARNKKGL